MLCLCLYHAAAACQSLPPSSFPQEEPEGDFGRSLNGISVPLSNVPAAVVILYSCCCHRSSLPSPSRDAVRRAGGTTCELRDRSSLSPAEASSCGDVLPGWVESVSLPTAARAWRPPLPGCDGSTQIYRNHVRALPHLQSFKASALAVPTSGSAARTSRCAGD